MISAMLEASFFKCALCWIEKGFLLNDIAILYHCCHAGSIFFVISTVLKLKKIHPE
jgi:hypothetical protein